MDRDQSSCAMIDRGACLGARLGATADDKLLGYTVLGQRLSFEDRADSTVADHCDASCVFEEIAGDG